MVASFITFIVTTALHILYRLFISQSVVTSQQREKKRNGPCARSHAAEEHHITITPPSYIITDLAAQSPPPYIPPSSSISFESLRVLFFFSIWYFGEDSEKKSNATADGICTRKRKSDAEKKSNQRHLKSITELFTNFYNLSIRNKQEWNEFGTFFHISSLYITSFKIRLYHRTSFVLGMHCTCLSGRHKGGARNNEKLLVFA